MTKDIYIKGAKEHNLKNIDLKIPRDKLVVFTGLSGSGKSSLAFDTIYAEGQRRYVESLSAYARQFLGQMDKPDVEYIEGLSPAISIDQKTTSKNPRSTVGTVTEIYDYLRLLFANIGIPHCPNCGKKIERQTVDQIVDHVLSHKKGHRIQILAPVVRGKKGTHVKIFKDALKSGFIRVRVNGETLEITDDITLDKNIKHNIEIVIDRLILKDDISKRLTDSIETALHLSDGLVIVDFIGHNEHLYSENLACTDCNISIEDLVPRMFSFNSPFGACPTCHGLGIQSKVDPDLVIPDKSKSLMENAIRASGWRKSDSDSIAYAYFKALSEKYNFSMETPIEDLPKKILDIILYGNKGQKFTIKYTTENYKGEHKTSFEGVITNLERRYMETNSNYIRREIEQLMTLDTCPDCMGMRLKKESLSVYVGGKNIIEITNLPILKINEFFTNLKLTNKEEMIAYQIVKEINERVKFLIDVGLDYLTLSRASGTLSGGEAQRIRLATQIGSGLMGVLYILDEPSIGLHQRDNNRLLSTLKRLRNLGNTLIVVEHDEDTIRESDYIVDIGPGAGVHGGEVVFKGTPKQLLKSTASMTGKYLSGKMKIPLPEKRRKSNGKWIKISNARENNLKSIDVEIPVGLFTCITGVSGSGKSSLINEILYKSLAEKLNRAHIKPGLHDSIEGLEYLDKVININQSPIGRTPRSNPATYTKVFTHIRELFAKTNEAKSRGYKPGRFSFNVQGGRCESCSGDGIIKIEMHFLPDVYVPCEVCKGKRYNRETLEVKYKGKNIHQVLDMTVEEGLEFFKNIPNIKKILKTLDDVGLGYIRIGQPSTTLSGGEAQRIKLATELSKRSTGKTVYLLDEPTTGLHMHDVNSLIKVLQRLADQGNSIIVIEHNLDVIKTSDYIIDLGPEGGDKGGEIVCQGSPEEVIKNDKSYTAMYLKKMLEV